MITRFESFPKLPGCRPPPTLPPALPEGFNTLPKGDAFVDAPAARNSHDRQAGPEADGLSCTLCSVVRKGSLLRSDRCRGSLLSALTDASSAGGSQL
jgi:hypothetical protein